MTYYRSPIPRRTTTKSRRHWLRWLLTLAVISTALLSPLIWIKNQSDKPNVTRSQQTGVMQAAVATSETVAASSFDKTLFSNNDPTSPWVIVNKQRALSTINYAPNDLTVPNLPLKGSRTTDSMHVRAEVAKALESLATTAQSNGINLRLISGYRSYETQQSVYNSEVRAYGQAAADRESARPGHSEHQTGWAADIGNADGKCDIQACFGETTAGKWVAANAYKFGFVIRYPKDKESTTGYIYEPWHLRYVGPKLSTEMHDKNINTIEEFFDLPAAADY